MNPQFLPLKEKLSEVLLGKEEVIELTLIAALGGGHLLIEDLPGVGKTSLARAVAQLLGGAFFQRVQFTADLMPSDLTGVSVFKEGGGEREGGFELIKGPLFCNVLLADEINRASPKAQSSLLEAMAEGRVSVDRQTHELPQPFWVIATQNPSSFEGTFPLPESQLDRFGLSISIGYPTPKGEREAMRRLGAHLQAHTQGDQLEPLMSLAEWRSAREASLEVFVSDELIEVMVELAQRSRAHPDLKVGVSTRGLLGWQRACMSLAHLFGRSFVTPDDVKRLAPFALAHRVLPKRSTLKLEVRRALIEALVAELRWPT
jgi:MoxR-like ATPase